MTASSLAFDVVDIDVDADLALGADTAADRPFRQVGRTDFDLASPILTEPAPQITQMDFEVEAPGLMDPPPQVVQLDFAVDVA
ncbi:hypothetical protein ACFWNL_20245 [Kitasatospora sp. NPDC058397]|uniref:hypothetical protein n=1 Tax=unclassified Kitasatospora TaxID=2633591 RepID=UPI00365B5BCD